MEMHDGGDALTNGTTQPPKLPHMASEPSDHGLAGFGRERDGKALNPIPPIEIQVEDLPDDARHAAQHCRIGSHYEDRGGQGWVTNPTHDSLYRRRRPLFDLCCEQRMKRRRLFGERVGIG